MLDAYRGLIDELLATPSEIREVLAAGQGDENSPRIRRLIAELRDRDRIVLGRVQTITKQANPYLTELAVPEPATNEPLDTLLESMETSRGNLVSLLMNLSLRDWERVAVHEREGEVTLADEIEDHVEFDEAQRDRLRQLVSAG
jgi:hypothetical protein